MEEEIAYLMSRLNNELRILNEIVPALLEAHKNRGSSDEEPTWRLQEAAEELTWKLQEAAELARRRAALNALRIASNLLSQNSTGEAWPVFEIARHLQNRLSQGEQPGKGAIMVSTIGAKYITFRQ